MVRPKDMGGAPPHKNNLIGTAAGGVSKLGPLKTTHAALNRSLLFHPRASTCLLPDEPEAPVVLDPRLKHWPEEDS